MSAKSPITKEAGDGDLIIGTIDPQNPHKVNINPAVLKARQEGLIAFARDYLWDPAAEGSPKKDAFAVGMEFGQYSQDLATVLAFAKSIGCQVVQPSANHIDLARAATDSAYRLKIWNAFAAAGLPLTSVSIHCDTCAALSILDNPRAGIFTPADIAKQSLGPLGTSNAHLNRIALMFIGAAQLGIPALHLFWGMPDNLAPYSWPPQKPEEVTAMRIKFVSLVKPLLELAERLGLDTGHEIHFGTIAMTADDLIAVWQMLGKPKNFCVGIDPSHFFHGETWLQAMDKLRKAGMKVVLAHAKNAVVRPGRPLFGQEMDDRYCGRAFTSLDDPAGFVSMWEYLGALTVSGIVEFWFSHGLPVPVHVEAENPFFNIKAVTTKGVKYLRSITDDLELASGHYTDAMRRDTPTETATTAPAEPVAAGTPEEPAAAPAPAANAGQPELPLAPESVDMGGGSADNTPREAAAEPLGSPVPPEVTGQATRADSTAEPEPTAGATETVAPGDENAPPTPASNLEEPPAGTPAMPEVEAPVPTAAEAAAALADATPPHPMPKEALAKKAGKTPKPAKAKTETAAPGSEAKPASNDAATLAREAESC